MRPRSIGRRLALQYLFMADLHNYQDVETPHEFFQTQRRAILESSASADGDFVYDKDDPYQDEAENFAYLLIREVEAHQNELDAAIEQVANNWSLSRMGVIERNVIRIAAAELRQGDTPRNVVIDEAVELAKRFGTRESGAFVNGIADRIAQNANNAQSRKREN